jgi:hypothetical protein
MYKDAQQECRQMYLPDDAGVDSAKRAVIYETWTRKGPGEDVWLVFVNAVGNEGDELTFAYPCNVEPGVTVKKIIRHAQRQHEQFGRPPIKGRAQVIHVTQDFINELRSGEVVEPGRGVCDFCCDDTPAATKFEACDFVMQSGKLSLGGWMACPSCSRLVESRDMEGLAKRMVETSGINSERSWEVARRQVQDFFLHKI